MKQVLVTGFEPWSDLRSNPSQDVAGSLGGAVLPVDPELSVKMLFQHIDEQKPEALVMLGFDSDREVISIERCAYNVYSDEQSKEREPISQEGPFSLSSTAPALEIEEVVRKVEPRSRYSITPGTFVCNHLYYRALSDFGGAAIFVHLPDTSYISLENQIAAIAAIEQFLSKK